MEILRQILSTLTVIIFALQASIATLPVQNQGAQIGVAGASAIIHKQTRGNSVVGATAVSVNIAATTAGDILIVGVNSTNGLPISVTDDKNNIYVPATTMTDPSGLGQAIYYAKNVAAGVSIITVNVPYGDVDMVVSEYTGIDALTPLDKTQKFDNGYNTTSSFTSGTTATITQPDELLWGFASDVVVGKPVWTAGTGWSARKTQGGSFVQDRVVAATGAYASSGTFTHGADWNIWALIATFKPAGSASSAAPVISSFSDSPASITGSGSSSLSWTVSGTPTSTSTPSPVLSSTSAPVLFFTDLIWGPKTGWEGSDTKGAAVTIWGKNFGSSRGNSFVTVNGAQLTSTSDYAEWGAIGPARGMERITFWVNSSASNGSGNITVTVDGATSNPLPFNVTNGKIYFISPSGNNSNNGLYASPQGGSNGPFKDVWKFNPCTPTDPMHVPGSCNPSQDGQYIVYVRSGTYTTLDVDNTFVALRGPYGAPDKQKALIGYPGETPIFNTINAVGGIAWTANYAPYGFNSYFTYAKLTGIGGTEPFSTIFGSYNRIIGNTFKDYLAYDQAGIVGINDSKYTNIYGNLFDHNGNDSMKHNVYIKTQATLGFTAGVDQSTLYTDVGWNEFANAIASDKAGGVIFISHEGTPPVVNFKTDHVYIHNNYFHDGNMDFIFIGDNTPLGMIGKNIYVYNNIMKGNTSVNSGITIYDGADNVNFYNNTFYQMGGSGSKALAWQTGNTRSFWKNNIWYTKNGQPAFYIETFKGATFNSDHDLFYNTAVPGDSGMTVTGAKTGNPLFNNVALGDFSLLAGSPAIDAGTLGVNFMVASDYSGTLRPQGSAFDMGAYEFSPGSPSPTSSPAPVLAPPAPAPAPSPSPSGGGGGGGGSSSGVQSPKITPAPVPPAVVPPALTPTQPLSKRISSNLSFGARSADVVTLQNFLVKQGYLTPDNATGFFGRATEAAVKSFQKAQGIVSRGSPSTSGYGAVGPKTRAKINAMQK